MARDEDMYEGYAVQDYRSVRPDLGTVHAGIRSLHADFELIHSGSSTGGCCLLALGDQLQDCFDRLKTLAYFQLHDC